MLAVVLVVLAGLWEAVIALSDPPQRRAIDTPSWAIVFPRSRRTRGLVISAGACLFVFAAWSASGLTIALVTAGWLFACWGLIGEWYWFRRRWTYIAISLAFTVVAVQHIWGPFLAAVLSALILLQIYLTSAVRKFLDPSFRSGKALIGFFLHRQLEALASRDTRHRRNALRWIVDQRHTWLWPALSIATITAELALAVLAVYPVRLPALYFLIALPLHVAFAALLPLRIPSFSAAMIALGVVALGHSLLWNLS